MNFARCIVFVLLISPFCSTIALAVAPQELHRTGSAAGSKSELVSNELIFLHWADAGHVIYGSASELFCEHVSTKTVVWKRVFYKDPIEYVTESNGYLTILKSGGVEQVDSLTGESTGSVTSNVLRKVGIVPITAFSAADNKIVIVNRSMDFGTNGYVVDLRNGTIEKTFRLDPSIVTKPCQWGFSENKFISVVYDSFVCIRDIENDQDVYISKTRLDFDIRGFRPPSIVLSSPIYFSAASKLIYVSNGGIKGAEEIVILNTGSKDSKNIVVGQGSISIDVNFSKKLVATVLSSGELRILDFDGKLIGFGTMDGYSKELFASIAPDGNSMIAGGTTYNLIYFRVMGKNGSPDGKGSRKNNLIN